MLSSAHKSEINLIVLIIAGPYKTVNEKYVCMRCNKISLLFTVKDA